MELVDQGLISFGCSLGKVVPLLELNIPLLSLQLLYLLMQVGNFLFVGVSSVNQAEVEGVDSHKDDFVLVIVGLGVMVLFGKWS